MICKIIKALQNYASDKELIITYDASEYGDFFRIGKMDYDDTFYIYVTFQMYQMMAILIAYDEYEDIDFLYTLLEDEVIRMLESDKPIQNKEIIEDIWGEKV